MSVDEFLKEIEDLKKAEEGKHNEEVIPVAPPSKRAKTVSLKPVQMLKKDVERKVEVTSAPPTVNQEFLHNMFGLEKKTLPTQSTRESPSAVKSPSVPLKLSSGVDEKQPNNAEFDLFVGNLSPEARNDHLMKVFKDYQSVTKVNVVLDSTKERSKGYGFVSFSDPKEMLRAMREKNGKLCGNRPMTISKAKGSSKEHKI